METLLGANVSVKKDHVSGKGAPRVVPDVFNARDASKVEDTRVLLNDHGQCLKEGMKSYFTTPGRSKVMEIEGKANIGTNKVDGGVRRGSAKVIVRVQPK